MIAVFLFTVAEGAVELAPELLADVDGDVLAPGCAEDWDGAAPVGTGELGDVNGAPAILAWTGSEPFVAVQVHVGEQGLIDEVLIFLNPEKLTGLGSVRSLTVR